jgi:GcrA cell cycle regulator
MGVVGGRCLRRCRSAVCAALAGRGVLMTENETNKKASPWTIEKIEQLKMLWIDGNLSTEKIGRKIGMSKGSVIGKAHRLNLAKRASVKIGKPNETRRPIARKDSRTLPSYRMCAWPIGHPINDDFHYCGKTVQPGSSYCSPHHSRAYIPRKKQHDS